ncbi:MAG: putative porin [Candidatus Latescibacter sp.]|nr:putative porin [Candidatus Latescibacter sp.]
MKYRIQKRAILLSAILGILPTASYSQTLSFSPAGALVFKGDFRYRHQYSKEENMEQRNRDRFRLRLNMTAAVQENVNIIAGLATGINNSPTTEIQDMTGGFSKKQVWLDLAYIDWTTPITGLKVQGGKIKNPFYTVARSQLIWDTDLNPEGLAILCSGTSKPMGFFINCAFFDVEERAAAKDSYLLGGQVGLKHTDSSGNVILGASFYDYLNSRGFPTFYDPAKSYGNSVDAGKLYLFDYRMAEVFGEISTTKPGFPLDIQADYVANMAPDVKAGLGYFAGISLGKTANPGSWALRIQYRKLEKDAVIGVFTDSEFAGSGTDNKGWVFGADFQAARNITAGLSYYKNQKGIANGLDFTRMDFDLSFNF